MGGILPFQTTYTAFPPIAIAGLLESADNGRDLTTMKNADSVSIPFGLAVAFKPSPATDKDAYLPALSSDNVAGIVAHSNAFARVWTDQSGNSFGDLDATGLVVGVMMNVLRRGKIAVVSQTGNAVGDRLFVSTQSAGAYTGKGQLGNVTATNAIDCTTKAEWLTSATAGGFAWLDCNFVAK